MLSCYLIVKNAADTLINTIVSVKGLADEVIVVDDGSTDGSVMLAMRYGARVLKYPNPSEGEKRTYAVEQCRGDWILCLDADEVVTPALGEEIRAAAQDPKYDGYQIPFQNHFLGRPLHYGGENYSSLRLFKKAKSSVENTPIHAFHKVGKGREGMLKEKLLHYSYRSLGQLYAKFTDYAKREAVRKTATGERTGLKKLTMYPVHMFWARFFKDQGYKDGWFRIPLDLGFAYMEWLTYVLMIFMKK